MARMTIESSIDEHTLETVRGGLSEACKQDMQAGAGHGATPGVAHGLAFVPFTAGWSSLAPLVTSPLGAAIPYLFSPNCRTPTS
jgi:hypothetical protein